MDFSVFLNENQNSNMFLNVNRVKDNLSVYGLGLNERAFFVSNLKCKKLYVASSETSILRLSTQLMSLGQRVLSVEHLQDNIFYADNVKDEVCERLINVLSSMAKDDYDCLIVTSEMLMQRIPSKKALYDAIIELRVGSEYNLEELRSKLIKSGYKRTDMVERQGEFSIRGDVLDIYPSGIDETPCRIDFFGDEIESIKHIDIINYVSGATLTELKIAPNTLLLDEVDIEFASKDNVKNLGRQIELYEDGVRDYSVYDLLPYRVSGGRFLDYFDVVVVEEPNIVYNSVLGLLNQKYEQIERQIKDGLATKKYFDFYVDKKSLFDTKSVKVGLFSVSGRNPMFFSENVLNFNCLHVANYSNSNDMLKQDLKYFDMQGFTVVFCANSDNNYTVIEDRLLRLGIKFKACKNQEEIELGGFNLIKNKLAYSVGLVNEKLVLISTSDMLSKMPITTQTVTKKDKSKVFYLPKVGDYVVHEKHGIGKCVEVKKINFGISEKDYFVLQYAKGDILYLPTEYANQLSQYVSAAKEPKLNTLGSEQFERAKEKARASVKELAFDLRKLYAERQNAKGFVYDNDDYLMDQFQGAFEHDLTLDQEQAINDIKKDMQNGKVMDRLVCGDVGYGKTEVAMVSAYKTILAGKQVAFLSPTTILCRQHFNTVLNRMKGFMVRAGMLSRFNSTAQNKEILKKLQVGDIDIVCGTHRLLSKDVKFKDLGLLIVDEEQRFGVGDKEKIKQLKKSVNVITLTATPIPRTLEISLIGIRDISLITTPPKDRLPVQTVVTEYSDVILKDAILRELARDGQVLIVYNRVESIYEFKQRVKDLVPDAEIDVAHGQMDEKLLENAILRLYDRQTQILIATSLIENGVDLPYANTIFIVNADMLGLSQLYQLRGRVGRSNRVAYAYFTYDNQKQINENAYQRLEAIREFTELGSGFKIAMRDLEIRGAGNILGAKQHGHIDNIGYDMYCRILAEAIHESKSDEKKYEEAKIEVGLSASIPTSYIPDESERMKLYSDIAGISTHEELEDMLLRLKKLHGDVPIVTTELVTVALMKNLASKLNIKRIVINNFAKYIEFHDLTCITPSIKESILNEFKDTLILGGFNKVTLNGQLSIIKGQETILNFLKKNTK